MLDVSLGCCGGLSFLTRLPAGYAAPTPSPTPGPVPLTKLVVEGHSIPAAEGSYAETWIADNPSVPAVNNAVSGSGIADLEDRLAAMMAAEDPSHLVVDIGTNDINNTGLFATVEDYIDAVFAYVAAAKAIKPALVVGVCGILPVGDNWWAYEGFNARRAAYNAAMRAAVGDEIDFYVPLGDHPDMNDAAAENAALFGDEVHPTAAGYAIVEPVFAAVMDAIRDGDTGTTPDAFTLTDTGGDPDTAYYADTGPLTGMGIGESATGTISGATGAFTRGNTDTGPAFGTSPIAFMNGDVAVVRNTTGSAPDTAYDVTLTIGGASDTFTVTTAGSSALTTTFRAASGPDAGWSTGDNPSFSDVAWYAGRNIVAIWTEGAPATPSAISLGGTSGTLLAELESNPGGLNNVLQFWAVDKASDGSGTLALTASTVRSYGYALWSTDAGASLAGTVTREWESVASGTFAGDPITLPAGGSILILASAYPPDRTLAAATGCTERADIDGSQSGAELRFWAGERDSTGAPGFDYSGDSWINAELLAIALEPGS